MTSWPEGRRSRPPRRVSRSWDGAELIIMEQIYGEGIRQAGVVRARASGDLANALMRAPSAITRIEGAELVELAPETVARLLADLRFPLKFFTTPPVPISSLQFRLQQKVRKGDVEY